MAYADDLKTARDQIAVIIKEITVDPKPSYSIDGESYSWGEYLAQLMSQLNTLNDAIGASDPFEVTEYGY